MTILEEIIARKRSDLAKKPEQWKHQPCNSEKRSLVEVLKSGKQFLAEFKRKSPSAGWIYEEAQVGEIIKAYTRGIDKLAGFSVLTDGPYFGGSLADLEAARRATSLPVLRKDFVVDASQIKMAKAVGADVVLLIAAVLTKAEVRDFTSLALDLDLEVLFEIKDEEELDLWDPRIPLLGVNNRNLHDFSTDYRRSLALAPQLPSECLWISESGLSEDAQFKALLDAGFSGFLVGQSFMEGVKNAH